MAARARRPFAAVAVFLAYFEVDSHFPNDWAFVAWAVVALVISRRATPLSRAVGVAAWTAMLLVAFGTTASQAFNAFGQLNLQQQGMAIARVSSIPFVLPVVLLPAVLALVLAWERGGVLRAVAAGVTLALLGLGIGTWDQRTAWERYVEAAQPGSHPFARLIPPGAEVYWHGDTLATWLLLLRPQFMSLNQVSGLLFNRDTAYVAVSRLPYLLATQPDAKNCDTLSWFGADTRILPQCQLSRDAFFGMCRAQPIHPDFLVASVDFQAGVVARWRFAPADGTPPVDYSLYDCARIR